MQFDIDQVVEILQRTPMVVRGMLEGLSKQWVHSNYGENTFSPFDVVGHLIHGERTDWIPRARIILEEGEQKRFEPFDRYAMYLASQDQTIENLLDEFESLRDENLVTLKSLNIQSSDYHRKGMHPELGAVTLAELLATWVCHDLNHISQIAKAMACQFENAVGPWRAYLSVLRR